MRRVAEAISKVQVGTDRTAAELALSRLKADLVEVDKKLANPRATLPSRYLDVVRVTKRTPGEWVAVIVFVPTAAVSILFLLGLILGSVTVRNLTLWIVLGTILVTSGRFAFGRSLGGVTKAVAEYSASLEAERAEILRQIAENQRRVR